MSRVVDGCTSLRLSPGQSEELMQWATMMHIRLGLDGWGVVLDLRDHDPISDGPLDRMGWHDWGHYQSTVHVWVPAEWTKSEEELMDYLRDLIAHEFRHVFQSKYDVNFGDQPPSSYDEYCRHHVNRQEERDADIWAAQMVSEYKRGHK